ncbi:MAG: hypothetical protein KF745_11795 [Phycisphaeraceae bacterium]|nr:hypothetical protein [Phycisphaeraceae bacterium]
MDDMLAVQIGVPLLLVACLLASVEIGYRVGRRRLRGSDSVKVFETGAIQGAMLGLLGLLLGFSFAGAAGRFIERQDLISREANAIGTAYLRSDLLDETHGAALRAALAAYVDHRVVTSRSLQRGLTTQAAAEIAEFHRRLWRAARAGVEARPPTMVLVIGSVNEVIDLHAARIAAGRKHLPALVLALLLCCSILSLGVMGYAGALSRHRNTTMTSVIAILIGAALWTTIDLDWSRIGLIRVSDSALVELQGAISDQEKTASHTPA